MASGWFSKGSASRSIAVGFGCLAIGLGAISTVAGVQETAVGSRTAARQVAIGGGLAGGMVEELPGGIAYGWNASEGVTLPNAGPAKP
jgi:hypothetical protein